MKMHRKLTIVCCLIMGGVFSYFGFGYAMQQASILKANNIVYHLQTDANSVTADNITLALNSYHLFLDQQPSALIYSYVSFLEFVLAHRVGVFSLSGNEHLAKSKKYIELSLAKRPFYGHGWIRYAYILSMLGEPIQRVTKAYMLSIYSAPYNPSIIFHRLKLAPLVFNYASQDEQFNILEQFRIAWRINPTIVMQQLSGESGHSLLALALEYNQQELHRYKALREKQLQ